MPPRKTTLIIIQENTVLISTKRENIHGSWIFIQINFEEPASKNGKV